MNTEQEAREYLRQLKNFYTNLVIYGTVFAICFLIWLANGGSFWPIWVLLALGASAFIQGLKLGIFPMLKDLFPFLRSDWEEQRLKEIFEKESLKGYKSPSSDKDSSHD
jgi:hypothetical protein